MSTTQPAWVAQGREFLEESKIDLAVSRLLSKSKDVGIKRRRLYHIQQALEKGVKSYIPALLVGFRGVPKMVDYRMEFEKRLRSSTTATDIVKSRIEKLSGELSTPKGLGHNPGQKLEMKEFVEDINLYLDLMEVPEEEARPAKEALGTFDKGTVSDELARIASAEENRKRVGEKSLKILEQERARVETPKALLELANRVSFPIFLTSTVEMIYYLSLLSRLSRYEQACRYPGAGEVPEELILNIEVLEVRVQKMIGWITEFFDDSALVALFDQMYFRSNG